MVKKIKQWLYFPLANYFRFWADIRLKKWQPRIILITGSSGKTTLLHLLESQLGSKARYSHQANSSFGIPFNILGLKRKTLLPYEWLLLFLLAPLKSLFPAYKQKIYVVEADCDRAREGKFLGRWLKPEVVLWLNSHQTHQAGFKKLKHKSIKATIAHEFGYFIEYAQELAVVNADLTQITKQLDRTKAKVIKIHKKDCLQGYSVNLTGTEFKIKNTYYSFKALLPENTIYSLAICLEVLKYLKIKSDKSFAKFSHPPGRSNSFQGKKNTTIIDSTYNNADLKALMAVVKMFSNISTPKKWAVLGDILEQGENEANVHRELAKHLLNHKFQKLILVGPRVSKHTYPLLEGKKKNIIALTKPTQALEYLNQYLEGEEVILFKGVRFLEGVIEKLLKNPKDAQKLCRREKAWQKRREKWGL